MPPPHRADPRCPATYGGFETTRSNVWRRCAGSAPNQSPDGGADPCACSPHAGDVRPRHGEGIGADIGGPHLGTDPLHGDRQRDRARRRCPGRPHASVGSRPPRASSSSRATSTTDSVSGRGISTRRSTIRSSRRNPQEPSTYCSGSPAARRATMSSKRATPRSVASSPSAPDRPAGATSSTLRDDPAGVDLGRRRTGRRQPLDGVGQQLPPGDRAVRCGAHVCRAHGVAASPTTSVSRRARSSVTSASLISSSSPRSTRSRW